MKILTTILLMISSTSHGAIPANVGNLMDYTTHPCTDFYQHACGGWLNKNPLQRGQEKIEKTFQPIDKHVTHIINDILAAKHPILSPFWDSCINFGKHKHFGKVILEDDLNHIEKATTRSDILASAGELIRAGTTAFTMFQIKPDHNGMETNTVYLSPADLTFAITTEIDWYTEENFTRIKKTYHTYIKELMRLSGFSLFKTHHQPVDAVMEIEQKLAMIQRQSSEDQLLELTIKEAIKEFPITIGAFVHGMGLVENSNLEEAAKIYIENGRYFRTMEKIIETISVDDLKVYLAYVVLHSRAQWLDKDFYQVWYNFFGKSLVSPPSRHDICVENVLTYMPDLIGKYYTEKQMDPTHVEEIRVMTKLLNESMSRHVEKTIWLTREEKELAQMKLHNMVALIGHPNKPKTYPDTLSSEDYASNMYTLLFHKFDVAMKKIGQPGNRMEWDTSAALTNAFYSPQKNALVIPAGMLQPPLYNGHKVHPALNYGSIGPIIGHELTHGFDLKGCRYDQYGNKQNWWSQMTFKLYDLRAQCFAKAYSSFQVNGQGVDGKVALNENIANSGGLALAWDAYRQHTHFDRDSYDVTSTEADKLFFIAYAQTWCTNMHDDYKTQRLQHEILPKYRVNGVLMHNDDFNEVFQCHVHSPMNPVNKCRVW